MHHHLSLLLALASLLICGCSTTAHWPGRPSTSAIASVVPHANVDVTRPTALTEARYKVEAVSFKAIDEDGYDRPFISDEIVVIFNDAQRGIYAVSREFDDVDAGEQRAFNATENCMVPIRIPDENHPYPSWVMRSSGPWACTDAGIPGPFSFQVLMYEDDSGFIHDCLGTFTGCSFEIGYPGDNDDLIGRQTLAFSAAELGAAMPNVHDTYEDTITLGPCYDERVMTCGEGLWSPTGPLYTFTYRITRLPDARVNPVLDPTPN